METTQPKQKKYTVPAILLVVIIAGSIFGVKQYTYYQSHEDTDDAQVDGDLSTVVSRVGGYINTINFEDNQRVTKGQTLVTLEDQEYRIKLNRQWQHKRLQVPKLSFRNSGISYTCSITRVQSSDRRSKSQIMAGESGLRSLCSLNQKWFCFAADF